MYCINVHTFISGRQIGSEQGTPPTIRNASIAGFCKQLLYLQTGFSGFSAYQSNFESLWSLGTSYTTWTSFNQCHIKFRRPKGDINAPRYHLISNVVSFNDCDVIYFANCKLPIPLVFKAPKVNINGGNIEGGVVLSGDFTTVGGGKLNNVFYTNVRHKCLGTILSDTYTGVNIKLFGDKPIPGYAKIITRKDQKFNLEKQTYKFIYLGGYKIAENKGETSFRLKKDKNIVPLGSSVVAYSRQHKTHLGYVSKVEGNLITLKGVPKLNKEMEMDVYLCVLFTLNDVIEKDI